MSVSSGWLVEGDAGGGDKGGGSIGKRIGAAGGCSDDDACRAMPALTKASNSAKALKSDCWEAIFGTKLEANAAKEAKGREEEAQARDKGVVHLSQKWATGRERNQSTPEADEVRRSTPEAE